MGQLDASIVTAALPQLASAFGSAIGAVEWISLAYALGIVATIVLVGHVSDAVGHKLVYLIGFVVFTIASALCGCAVSLPMLIAMRTLQAFGAAMLQANSVALIKRAASGESLGRAMGVRGAAQAFALAIGFAGGALVVSQFGWRWLFWLNIPAGALGIGLGRATLPGPRVRRAPDLSDWLGALLLAPAAGLPLLYLSLAPSVGFDNAPLLVALASGVAFAVVFVLRERRVRMPLIPPALFRIPAVSAGLGASLVSYAAVFGALLAISYSLHDERAGAWTKVGVLVILPGFLAIAAPLAGRLVRRGRGVRGLTITGSACMGLALVSMAVVHGRPALLIGLALTGVGQGMFAPANDSGIVHGASELRVAADGAATAERTGVVAGAMNMCRSIGTALGVVIAGLAYAVGAGTRGRAAGAASAASATRGLDTSLAVLGALAITTAVALMFVPVGHRPRHRKARGRRRTAS
jgi:MFS family permease